MPEKLNAHVFWVVENNNTLDENNMIEFQTPQNIIKGMIKNRVKKLSWSRGKMLNTLREYGDDFVFVCAFDISNQEFYNIEIKNPDQIVPVEYPLVYSVTQLNEFLKVHVHFQDQCRIEKLIRKSFYD